MQAFLSRVGHGFLRSPNVRKPAETHTSTPDDLLHHIGSPFAPEKRSTESQERAA